MLDPGRYLLGVLEILLLGGFAWLGGAARARAGCCRGSRGRRRIWRRAVIALALLIWAAELLGSFGLWDPVPYLLLVAVVGAGLLEVRAAAAGGGGRSPAPYSAGRGAE